MKIIGIAAAIAAFALLIWYVLWGRAWLKTKPWAKGFFDWVEPIEIMLYKKSEVILLARLKMFVGLLLTLLTQLGSIDLSPIMPLVPDQYESYVRFAFNLLPMVVTVLGAMDERLRNETSLPLDIIAAPEKNMTPEVKETIAALQEKKVEAVAAVKNGNGH